MTAPCVGYQANNSSNYYYHTLIGLVLIYSVLIVYIFLDVLQLIDLYSNDHVLLWEISAFRFLIYVTVSVFTAYYIFLGYITAEISLIFQIFTIGVTLITSLIVFGKRFTMPLKENQNQKFYYVSILSAFIKCIIALVNFIMLLYVYQTDIDGIGNVELVMLLVFALVGIVTSVVDMARYSGMFGIFTKTPPKPPKTNAPKN